MTTALFLFYLAGLSVAIKNVAIGSVVAVVLVLVFSPLILMGLDGYNIEAKSLWPPVRRFIKWLAIFLTFALLIPTQQFLYIAAGLSVGQEVADTEIANKAYTLLNDRLDELLQDRPMREKNEGK